MSFVKIKLWLSANRFNALLVLVLLLAGPTFWWSLPKPLFNSPYSVVLYGESDQLLGARIAQDQQWRFPPSVKVPDKFQKAIVHYEDKRFQYHIGVDPIAILRSLYLNVSEGHIVSGGSTLTMQVIRLSRKNPPRTYFEKIKEIFLAIRLELSFSKTEIISFYVAHAPFGGNVVGLQAAAWRYFGRNSDQLTWAESCMLAVLPKNPAMVHPGRNRSQLLRARNDLLNDLNAANVISALELELALAEPLPEKPHPMPRLAPHLLDTLVASGKKGRVESPIDVQMQRNVNRIVMQHAKEMEQRGIGNVAAIVVDNRNFEVKAYIGNSGYDTRRERGMAIDLLHRPRSTGSILKPLLYALMLQDGETLPSTLVSDLPTHIEGYSPENYDRKYRGAVSAKNALARSLNIPAVRMLRQYGVERFYDSLKGMGISTLFRSPEKYGLTLILGGAEGTLWEIVQIYANLAAIARDSLPINEHNYSNLLTVLNEDVEHGEMTNVGPGAAWLMLEALVEVSRPGDEGNWRQYSSSHKIAWKTGTSYGLRDGWAVGSTSAYTVGVWAGNADGEGVPGLTGLGAAAPIMLEIFKSLPPSDWFMPPYEDLKTVQVCSDDGYLATPDCDSVDQLIPSSSHFSKVSPYHRKIHVDHSKQWRVDSGCESVSSMIPENWFVLPPGPEYYYRFSHPEYRKIPPFRPDCLQGQDDDPLEILYPEVGTRIFIPIDIDGNYSSAVFEAVHRRSNATLHWHLDDEFVGSTNEFHQMAMFILPGEHRLTLVDGKGNLVERKFEVISR